MKQNDKKMIEGNKMEKTQLKYVMIPEEGSRKGGIEEATLKRE